MVTGAPAVLLAVLLGAAVVSAGLLFGARGRDAAGSYLLGREADAAHLVMNTAMATMLTPWLTGWWRTALTTGFVALAACFAVLLAVGTVRPEGYWHTRRPVSAYHLLAAAAMAYGTAATPDMAGKSGMSGPHDGLDALHVPAGPTTVAWLLAAVFTLDALATLVLVTLLPDAAVSAAFQTVPGTGSAAVTGSESAAPDGRAPRSRATVDRRGLRIAAFPHVVMDLALPVVPAVCGFIVDVRVISG